MQMIDVLKRLAELDSTNPNVIKENTSVEECGPMGMIGGMEKPTTPATINITAGSGEELRGILGDIMKLAGVEKVTPDHLGVEHEPAVVTAEPAMAVGPAIGDRDDMRAVLDKMHDTSDEADDEQETDEGKDEFGIPGVNTTPNRPDAHKAFSATAHSQNTNDGDGDSSNGKRRTGMQPTATYESLMAEYKKFVAEDTDDSVNERMGEAIPIKLKFEDGTVKGEQIVDGDVTSMMTRQQLIQHFSEKYKKPVADIIVRTEPTPYQEPATRAHHEPYEEPGSVNPYGHRRGADSDFR